MTMVDRFLLKRKFSRGAKPTERDFADLIDATETFVEMPMTMVEPADVLVDLGLRTGLRTSSNGVLQLAEGSLWRVTRDIPNVGRTTYHTKYIPNGDTPYFRILEFQNGVYKGVQAPVPVGSSFTLDASTTTFALNLGRFDAQPNTTPPVLGFTTIEDIFRFELYKEDFITDTFLAQVPISDVVVAMNARLPKNDKYKVLMVGNSFSEDVSQYIVDIAKSAGLDVIFGNLHRPGESLQGHATQITSGAGSYTYYKRESVSGVITQDIRTSTSFVIGLTDEDWDVIVYQQSSPLSGRYETFNPYLQNIITFVNANKTNPNLKHALHMTWAYPTTSTETGFASYNNNQATMYAAITNAYKQAMLARDIDIVIPVGTAIQNARSIEHLQTLNNDMASDGFHLGPVGDYIGGLTIFETLLAPRYRKDLFDDVTFTVGSKYHSYLGKVAVKNAMLNPFNVTDI